MPKVTNIMSFNKTKMILLGGIFSTLSYSAQAFEEKPQAHQKAFSIQLEAAQYEHDDTRFETGPGLKIAVALTDSWYLTGMKTTNDLEVDVNPPAEFTHWMLGVGYQWQLASGNHLFVELKGETQKLAVDIARLEERGASVVFGGHFKLSERWELSPHIRLSDINIAEASGRSDESFFGAELSYQIDDSWRLGLNYELGDYDRSGLLVSFNF